VAIRPLVSRVRVAPEADPVAVAAPVDRVEGQVGRAADREAARADSVDPEAVAAVVAADPEDAVDGVDVRTQWRSAIAVLTLAISITGTSVSR
jgi:hypothetical protein